MRKRLPRLSLDSTNERRPLGNLSALVNTILFAGLRLTRERKLGPLLYFLGGTPLKRKCRTLGERSSKPTTRVGIALTHLSVVLHD